MNGWMRRNDHDSPTFSLLSFSFSSLLLFHSLRLLLIKMTFSGLFNLLLWAGSALCFLAYGIDPHKDQANLYLGGKRHAPGCTARCTGRLRLWLPPSS